MYVDERTNCFSNIAAVWSSDNGVPIAHARSPSGSEARMGRQQLSEASGLVVRCQLAMIRLMDQVPKARSAQTPSLHLSRKPSPHTPGPESGQDVPYPASPWTCRGRRAPRSSASRSADVARPVLGRARRRYGGPRWRSGTHQAPLNPVRVLRCRQIGKVARFHAKDGRFPGRGR